MMNPSNAILMLAALLNGPTAEVSSDSKIEIESVLVTLIQQVEVTARETGVLAKVMVREGQLVEQDAVLAQIEDSEARLAEEKAKIELDIAKEQAENDVNVRAAKKAHEVAKAELQRSHDAVKVFQKAVSQSELDRLRLASEQTELAIERSELERRTAKLTWNLKQNEHQLATVKLERRKIVAPISGVVVQVNQKRGEWVQPGQSVLRILRIDRLRAEGFLNASELYEDVTGRPVTLVVNLPGKPNVKFAGTVVFVSPEVNPVNGQIRVWAEFDNPQLLLRPGLRGKMTIQPGPTKSAKTAQKQSE